MQNRRVLRARLPKGTLESRSQEGMCEEVVKRSGAEGGKSVGFISYNKQTKEKSFVFTLLLIASFY